MPDTEQSNITALPLPDTVNSDLVETLGELLQMARDGEIVSGGFFFTLRDERVQTSMTNSRNQLLELAAAHRLLHRMHVKLDEGVELI